MLVGLVVLCGWFLKSETLIQLNPSFVPMQFNTALGFILCALCYVGLYNSIKWTKAFSGTLFFLGSVTLIQYLLSVNLGIDELFIDHYITVKSSHPGRMAPTTAVCFILVSFLSYGKLHQLKRVGLKTSLQWGLCASLFYLSTLAFLGYILKINMAFGWQKYTQMAIHTSFCFLVLSLGYFYHLISNEFKNRRRNYIPFALTSLIILIFILTAFKVEENQNKSARSSLSTNSLILASKLNLEIEESISAFKRLSYRITYFNDQNEKIWRDDTSQYLEDFKFYNSFFFINLQNSQRWSSPLGNRVSAPDVFWKNLKTSEDRSFVNFWSTAFPEVFIYAVTLGGVDNRLGYSLAVLDIDRLFNGILSKSDRALIPFKILSGDNIIFSNVGGDDYSLLGTAQVFDVFDNNWKIQFYSKPNSLSANESLIPEFIIIFGGVISILFGLVAFYLQRMKTLKEVAEVAERSKSTFLANMSHEIRTPLNGILGMTTLLKDEIKDGEAREKLKIIDTSGTALLAIINDILDIAKIDAGKYHIEKTTIHLESILKDQINLFKALATSKDLKIILDFKATEIIYLVSDGLRLRQVINNLLSNAIKFSTNGVISIEAELVENNVVITVQDQGIGISEENQQKLFNDFVQVESLATREFAGTGLGLSISRKLIRLLGGDIEVESKFGEGSVFKFWFPYEEGDVSTLSPEGNKVRFDSELAKGNPLNILCVDDNEVNLKVASSFLKKLGYRCELARSGEEALDKCIVKSYDIVFMDCHMPGMDGYEATEAIKALTHQIEKPIIIALSASSMQADVEKCYQAGMDDFIAKPLSMGILQQKLKYYSGL